MDRELLELYTDYLISSFSYTTATGLSIMSEGKVSHDKVSRFLNGSEFTSKELWKLIKADVRSVESKDGVIIIDDTIEEKPSTDENEIVNWYYDHCQGRSVKGINIISALYYSKGVRLPLLFTIVHKTKTVVDEKTKREKRISEKTKNEHFRDMVKTYIRNEIKFKYILSDVWYASSENMAYIKVELKKDFILPLKSNRKVALSKREKLNGKYVQVKDLKTKKDAVIQIFLEGIDFPLILVKQVFINEDGSEGILYLASSDLTLTSDSMITIYQKRWKVEEYHKSLKQHVSLCKSPTKVVRTQNNHVFAAIYAFFKLECMSMISKFNQTTLRTKLYIEALKAANQELLSMKVAFKMKF